MLGKGKNVLIALYAMERYSLFFFGLRSILSRSVGCMISCDEPYKIIVLRRMVLNHITQYMGWWIQADHSGSLYHITLYYGAENIVNHSPSIDSGIPYRPQGQTTSYWPNRLCFNAKPASSSRNQLQYPLQDQATELD